MANGLLLGIPSTQRRLDVGRTTVYRLLREGELQSVKIGRRTLITSASIDAYVRRLESSASTWPERIA